MTVVMDAVKNKKVNQCHKRMDSGLGSLKNGVLGLAGIDIIVIYVLKIRVYYYF